MRACVLLALIVGASAWTESCNEGAQSICPSGCSCSCTATCTYPPTQSPTATPTNTPTSPWGRCCGTNQETGENFCVVTDQDDCEAGRRRSAPAPRNFLDTLNRRDVDAEGTPLGGSWNGSADCTDACGNGVPITSGSANYSVDVSMAGLGSTGGISLTPVDAGELPAGSEAQLDGEVILAFEVTRYDGASVVPSGFLTAGNFIWVLIQNDPDIEDVEGYVVLRWDVDDEMWVDVQEECAGKIMSTDFVLDTTTDPNTLKVPLCHTSTFVLTTATDSKDSKVKKDKKDKAPSVGKDAKKSGKKEAGKAGKKSAAAGIAAGAAVGGTAVVVLGVAAVYKCKGKKAEKKSKKSKAGRAAAPTLPTGAMTV